MSVTKATASWEGTLKEGKGVVRLPSGTFEGPYSFVSRFERGAGPDTGTSPEELLAAAHAGCYAMALSARLSGAGFPPVRVDVESRISLESVDGGKSITKSHLVVRANVPGIGADAFQEHAAAAKAGCPVSRALAALEISVEATLVSA